MNFSRDFVDAAPVARLALVELARDGTRREWRFGEVSAASRALGTHLARVGVRRGDVVMTLIGNRPEWVFAMVACVRMGAVVLPCNEQLRAGDLRSRIAMTTPRAIVCDERNLNELSAAAPTCEVLTIPDASLLEPPATAKRQAVADVLPQDPVLITFTSGTTGVAKGIVHGHRYFTGQWLQAEHWLGARPGDLVWCTASSGWSKSARNVFIAPWLSGAAALLHDERFEPTARLKVLESEGVNVLCMAPTEYRVLAKRTVIRRYKSLRGLVAAGEALDPDVLQAWRDATGLEIRDGYGQTETGQLTSNPPGETTRTGSMGRPLPGVKLAVKNGELVLAAPPSDPTFFVGYLDGRPAPVNEPWHTGDRVQVDRDGYLYFVGRDDDVIISSGYRIGPFEVESVLMSHPAVEDVAAVAAPDSERGSVVRAVVVLRQGFTPKDSLAVELQEHVKAQTAPYKYPRIIEFVADLPKTASGKVKRSALRERS